MALVREQAFFYNLDNYRDNKIVRREILALLSLRPAFLDLVECIGNRLPDVTGYRLIEDQSTKSRANIASYVRSDIPVSGIRWLDLQGTWPRTEAPGTHEPRSFLHFRAGKMQRIVAHQAPRNALGWRALQVEGMEAITAAMKPYPNWFSRHRPRLLTWDANATLLSPYPNPIHLAAAIGGRVVRTRSVDNAVYRGDVEVIHDGNLFTINNVKLQSDHHKAIAYGFQLRAHWLKKWRR